jgi:23S rRNA pseudouridine2457 synthase
VAGPSTLRYVLFNKPYNVVCQFSGEPPTLKEFVPVGGVYPVGRLDRDSEGLLLLSSDGVLQHRLTDPRFGHPRTYWAQVEGIPDAHALEQLAAGVSLRDKTGDYRSRPAAVRLLPGDPDVPPREPPIRARRSIPTAWLELTLTEGRNRQVRRMTAAVGLPTLRLIRIRSGPLTLDGLKPGRWRDLTAGEIAELTAVSHEKAISGTISG